MINIGVFKTVADAASYGEKAIHAIDNGWTLDTIYLYAKIACSYARLAFEFAEDYEYKRITD